MIGAMLAISLATAPVGSDQLAIRSYQDCLAGLVRTNEKAGEENHLSFEMLFAKVKAECAVKRAAAREALSDYVFANPDLNRQPAMEDKDELIDDATIRWMNTAVHNMAGQVGER